MAIQEQGTKRPLSVGERFRFQPYYREDMFDEPPVEGTIPDPTAPELKLRPTVSTQKGTEIMLQMLLGQYEDKPVLRAYFDAFIQEFDLLFTQLDEVYLGRLIDYAIGDQLDVIGRIIDQAREIVIPGGTFFGFEGAPEHTEPDPTLYQMADRAAPAVGGVFKDGLFGNFITIPLNDLQYRRMLLAKGNIHNRHQINVDQIYISASTVMGFTPSAIRVTSTQQSVVLDMAEEVTTELDANLVDYFLRYNIPMGTQVAVNRIPLNTF